MKESDLADVCRIALICHPDFPEEDAVLEEKFNLSPLSCFVFSDENPASGNISDLSPVSRTSAIYGYCLAHPFKTNSIPALDCLLHKLPEKCDTLYIHDLALLPEAQGGGNGKKAVELLVAVAEREKLETLSLVAVHGSQVFWQKNGFKTVDVSKEMKQKLLTYSEDASYMTRNL
ncbi:GNAT family N-acetyltransferase [Bartonella sp. W8125]|uniref:GNAT family N-acetyltransferase n=1 Tax=Bartonella TaxID=773 RepID=UPI0018DBF83C|nr:GNAT family N-acetyltransferase [Bartonella choladocola]MBI0141535.1 GNAT family N-acetyltransferase [Bartonella choladocola]